MANIKSKTIYTVELNEDEYFLVIRGLESSMKESREAEFSVPLSLASLHEELKESIT